MDSPKWQKMTDVHCSDVWNMCTILLCMFWQTQWQTGDVLRDVNRVYWQERSTLTLQVQRFDRSEISVVKKQASKQPMASTATVVVPCIFAVVPCIFAVVPFAKFQIVLKNCPRRSAPCQDKIAVPIWDLWVLPCKLFAGQISVATKSKFAGEKSQTAALYIQVLQL